MFLELAVALVGLLVLLYVKRRPRTMDPQVMGRFVGEARPGETPAFRSLDAPEPLVSGPEHGYVTLYDVVEGMPKLNKDEYVGYRTLLKVHPFKTLTTVVNNETVVKTLNKYEMSPYHWLSSSDFYALIHRLANGLAALGIAPTQRIGLYCETRYEWMAMLLAASCKNITAVTVYPTLGAEAVRMALVQTDVKALVVSSETLAKIPQLDLPEDITLLCCDSEDPQQTRRQVTLSELQALGTAHPTPDVPPTAADIALIMFTSGTAREPKGVVVSQRNLLPLTQSYKTRMLYDKTTRYICYLPLAHIFEISIEMCLLVWGGSLGYASPKTFISLFCQNCKSDIAELNPDFMNGVPAIFNKVRKTITEKMLVAPALVRWCFAAACWVKQKLYIDYDCEPPLLFVPLIGLVDALILSRVKNEIFCDRLSTIFIGGSPLSTELQRYLQIIFPNVNISQGYGLTEACGPVCAMQPGDVAVNTVGCLYPNYEVKLVDVEEMGYSTTDTPPRGEVCLRGPSVAMGYFNMEQETREAFDADGWFHTGDIGSLDIGRLRIIDRKKNLVKQPCGEYISLEKVEMYYNSSEYADTVMVIADNFHDHCVGLVLPNRQKAVEFARTELHLELSESDEDMARVCAASEFKAVVGESLQAQAKDLNAHERIKDFVLIPDEWTPENGMLTAALKLRRVQIQQRYNALITPMFAND